MKTCPTLEGIFPTEYAQNLGASASDFYLGALNHLGKQNTLIAIELTSRFIRDYLTMQIADLPKEVPGEKGDPAAAPTSSAS